MLDKKIFKTKLSIEFLDANLIYYKISEHIAENTNEKLIYIDDDRGGFQISLNKEISLALSNILKRFAETGTLFPKEFLEQECKEDPLHC